MAFQEEVTWFEAEGKCQRLDGHLVSIHSKSKNSQVTSIFLNLGVANDQLYWAGAKRNELDGFAWTGKYFKQEYPNRRSVIDLVQSLIRSVSYGFFRKFIF